MSRNRYFKCAHCHKVTKRNPRIKSGQKYCGAKACQQERKNKWEKDKLQNDSRYKEKRIAAKRGWYKRNHADRYHDQYRKLHPNYQDSNRQGQATRNQKKGKEREFRKIVKTDTLFSESLTSKGLYMLLPYDEKKIVKTDAFIVQILSPCGFGVVSP
jgi:hypothetical protein